VLVLVALVIVLMAKLPALHAESVADGPLSPSAQGVDSKWGKSQRPATKDGAVSEATCDFGDATYVTSSTAGDRQSFNLSLDPANATKKIARVEISLCHRVSGSAMREASYSPFLRIAGAIHEGQAVAVKNIEGCVETTQVISFPAPLVWSEGSNFEVGLLKLPDQDTAKTVRICSIRATIYYEDDAPPAPPLPQVSISAAGSDSSNALWDVLVDNSASGSIDRSGIVIAAGQPDTALLGTTPPDACTVVPDTPSAWSCDVDAGSFLSLRLGRPRSALPSLCLGGGLPNWLASATLTDGTALAVSGATPAEPSEAAVPPDPVACPLPAVRLSPHAPTLSGGHAFWDLLIDQPEAEGLAREVRLTLSAALELAQVPAGVACTVAGTVVTCSVPASGDAAVVLGRAVTESALVSGNLCNGGAIAASIQSAELADGRPVTVDGGGPSAPVSHAVRDTSSCQPPGVAVAFAPGASGVVHHPSDVAWLVTISNPPGGLAGAVVHIRDPHATVRGGPAFSGATAACSGNILSDDGATCELQPGATVTWMVAPKPPPASSCAAQAFNHAVAYRMDGPAPWVELAGPEVVLTGDQSLCPRTVMVANHHFPPALPVEMPAIKLSGIGDPQPCLATRLPGEGVVLWECTVPASWAGAVETTPPPGWIEGDCPAGLTIPAADARVCAYRQARVAAVATLVTHGLPGDPIAGPTPSLDAVALPGGTPSADGLSWTWPPVAIDPLAGRAIIWQFDESLWRVIAGPAASGSGCELSPGDAAGEWQLNAPPGGDCLIAITLERLVATIVVNQRAIGAPAPPLTPDVDVDGKPLPIVWTGDGPGNTRWEAVVPVLPGGSVVEISAVLPTGWANASAAPGACDGAPSPAPALDPGPAAVLVATQPGDAVHLCLVNVAVGALQVNVTGYGLAPSPRMWRLISTVPGLPDLVIEAVEEPGASRHAGSSPLISPVPVGDYVIHLEGGQPACLPGAMAGDYETSAAVGAGAPGVVGGAPLPFTVSQAETVSIAFTETPCAAVLPPGAIELRVIHDVDGDGVLDPAEAPIPDWPLHVTGPGATSTVSTGTAGVLRYPVPAGGAYAVSPELPHGWRSTGPAVEEVTVGLGQEVQLVFLVQPVVSIHVSVSEVTVDHTAGRPGASWRVTLDGCGLRQFLETGPTGEVRFDDLPPAPACAYSLTVDQRDGWVLPHASATAAPRAPGEVAAFAFVAFSSAPATVVEVPALVSPVPEETTAPAATLLPGAALLDWSGGRVVVELAFAGAGDVAAVYHWDPQSGGWLRYLPGLPPALSDLHTLEPGRVYWVVVAPAKRT
jgi:hypothetical protein